MLSLRDSIGNLARAALVATGALALAACQVGPPTQVGPAPGPSVDLSEPVRVALLVPLGTGDPGREEIGQSLLNAARLAERDLQAVALDMRVYETGGTASGGNSAARRAVEEGAQVIVGPLFSTETSGAEPVAAAAGIPVLSFSNNPSVAGNGVYLLGMTFENTASRVVGYAASRGMRNVGVVYPNGLEGETARQAVRSAAGRQGSTVVAERGYDLSIRDIERDSAPIARSMREAGATAIVLADVPTGGLGFMADGLRGAGLASSEAQFLGMHRWDVSAEVLAQDSLQGGWFAAPDPALLGTFEARYRAAYGQRPHEIAGLAYDGIAAVGALVSDARARRLADPFSPANLTGAGGFAGVYGPFRLLPNGLNQRNLAVLEVRNGSASVIDRAPRAFTGLGL
jgi:ABC-type branched-subunit amino acid transport system substrate-binding protein